MDTETGVSQKDNTCLFKTCICHPSLLFRPILSSNPRTAYAKQCRPSLGGNNAYSSQMQNLISMYWQEFRKNVPQWILMCQMVLREWLQNIGLEREDFDNMEYSSLPLGLNICTKIPHPVLRVSSGDYQKHEHKNLP